MQLQYVLFILLLMTSSCFAVEATDLTLAVPLVAIIVAIFLAMMNMFAAAISDPRLTAWAKTELREFIAAIVLIALITGFFISSTGISTALTGSEDYIQESKTNIDEWLGNYNAAFEHVVRAATRIRISATYSPYINVPLWFMSISYSANPLGGMSLILIPLNIASQGLTNATFLFESLRLIVIFLSITAPKILLPLAFIARLIPFTRKLGNTLIAISIAGIVFLPFSIIVVDLMHDAINYPIPRISNLDILNADPISMTAAGIFCESSTLRTIMGLTDPGFAVVVCLPLLLIPPPFGTELFALCKPIVETVVYPLVMLLFQVTMSTLLAAWLAAYSAGAGEAYALDVFDQVYPFVRDVGNLVLMGYMDFILIAIMTITGARSLSAALGGEWYMAGIQRLI